MYCIFDGRTSRSLKLLCSRHGMRWFMGRDSSRAAEGPGKQTCDKNPVSVRGAAITSFKDACTFSATQAY